MIEKNAQSTYGHGRTVTDNLATWVKKEVLSGPFLTPPVKGFRSNSLMAVAQKDKVRLVLDMSRPKDASFNDNVDNLKLEQVTMSTARQFGYSVKDSGKYSIMSKFDMKDAYKLIPCQPKDYRLQGLCWLDRYFVDTRMIFGASTAVANYDTFSRTVKDLVLSKCSIPGHLVHRTLDDVPVVSPAHKDWGQEFAKAYKDTCEALNIPLAKECPNNDKAFVAQTEGRVLGIWFNTKNMTWSYPHDKLVPLLRDIHEVSEAGQAGLKQLQQLMGKINDVTLMMPFLKAFRKPANSLMASFMGNEDTVLPLPARVREDLAICAKAIASSATGLPIMARPSAPPIHHLRFTSDAAGAMMAKVDGLQVAVQDRWDRGVASVGHTSEGDIWFASRLTWPQDFLTKARDSKGSLYGAKSTTLETVGLLLPFLAIPSQLSGKHIVLQVDNIGALFGWENKQVKEDTAASILIRTLHIIEARLACKIHVRHLPRLSSPEGTLADHLSREETSSKEELQLIKAVERRPRSPALQGWLRNPVEDWDLALRILSDVTRHS